MTTFIASSQGASVYGAANIKVLKGLEAVRKRPGMYIGDTADGTGLHNMVFEVVDLALEGVLAGFAKEVSVTLNADGSASIRDDGRGMPTGVDPRAAISMPEALMTQLHAGGIFEDNQSGNAYLISSGPNGVGISVVNALSTRLDLRIWRDDKEHMVRFRDGVAEAPLAVVGPANGRHGTEITFWPSLEIFQNVTGFDSAALESRLHQQAAHTPGLRIVLQDGRDPNKPLRVMRCPNGLADYVRGGDRSGSTPIILKGEQNGIGVEAALSWGGPGNHQVHCFTNTVLQLNGGSHFDGFRAGLARVIGEHAEASGLTAKAGVSITGPDCCEGLSAALSVWAPYPKFSSQTKTLLVSPEVKAVVESIVADQLRLWLASHPAEAAAITSEALAAATARTARLDAAGAAREEASPATPGGLTYLEAVRQCPEAYIGDTGNGIGLLNMLYEVLDYALNEVRFTLATQITVTLNADGSATVLHNGIGFAPGNPDYGLTDPERVATEFRDPGMFGARHLPDHVPEDLEGEGLPVVNALSSCLELRIWRDDQEHLLRFRDGVAEAPITAIGPAAGKRGMAITFWPSLDVFHPANDFDYDTLARRLSEWSAFDPRMRFVLEDRRPGGRRLQRICHGGIGGLVRYLDCARRPVIDAPIVILLEDDAVLDLQVGLWWNDSPQEQVACYAEWIPQRDGGACLDGFHAGLSRAVLRYAQRHCDDADSQKIQIVDADVRSGLTAVVCVWGIEPGLCEVKSTIEHTVANQLTTWLDAHPKQAQAILAKVHHAASGRAISGLVQHPPAWRP